MTRAERKLQKLLDEQPQVPVTERTKSHRRLEDMTGEEKKEYWLRRKKQHFEAIKFLSGKETARKVHVEAQVTDELAGLRTGSTWTPERYKCRFCYGEDDTPRLEQFKIFEVVVGESRVKDKAFGTVHPTMTYVMDKYVVKCLHCRATTTIKKRRRVEHELEWRLAQMGKPYPITVTA